jgi:hypothetical protein
MISDYVHINAAAASYFMSLFWLRMCFIFMLASWFINSFVPLSSVYTECFYQESFLLQNEKRVNFMTKCTLALCMWQRSLLKSALKFMFLFINHQKSSFDYDSMGKS